MVLDWIWLVISVLLSLVGLLGCFIPVIPGLIFSWLALFIAYIAGIVNIETIWILLLFFAIILISLLDFYLPSLLTKKSGGTKFGEYGALIGGILGVFFGPLGVLFFPFLGAFLGEIIKDSTNFSRALRSAWGSFSGFLIGTGLKASAALWFIYFIFRYQLVFPF